MTYEEILNATKKLLEHRKRLKYGALRRQFDLDDRALEDLKTDMIRDPRVTVDEHGERFVWIGGAGTQMESFTRPSHEQRTRI